MNERERKISGVTVWGAAANLGLSAVKMAAGFWGHSAAMVADAVHSLSDLVSDIVVLIMVRVAGKGRDKNHDYGHGKFETLATLVVAVILLVVGGKLMASGIEKIRIVAGGGELTAPSLVALWAALLSIAVKEVLYRWTAAVGRKYSSKAVIANAWHHRSDALSSVGSALGIGGAILLGGKWAVLDPAVGCIISIVIIVVAVRMAIPSLEELTDASLPESVENEIISLAESVPGVRNVHNLKTRRTGPDIIVDAHIVVDSEITVAAAHAIATEVENVLSSRFGEETQVSIHIEPSEDSD